MPPELIAQNPIKDKAKTKFLVYQNGKINDSYFSNIIDFLQAEDVLVFNNVKVIKAKLIAKIVRSSSVVEFNLDQEIFEDGFVAENKRVWRAICKGSKKIKDGDRVDFAEDFGAKIIKKLDDGFCLLEFLSNDFDEKLEKYGKTPLPPYIKRDGSPTKDDEKNYQTVYASSGNAVAAPTAGLHFTNEIFEKLDEIGVKKAFVTLNVGAGTFLPVRSEKITDHKMHEEYFEISQETADLINLARKNGKRIIAVGTTSLRVLESVADENGVLQAKKTKTDIFIYPGYEFKVIDGLVTNFHLPKSTLFMLISAFVGKSQAQKIYQHAIDEKYRFFSYGDSSLLIP